MNKSDETGPFLFTFAKRKPGCQQNTIGNNSLQLHSIHPHDLGCHVNMLCIISSDAINDWGNVLETTTASRENNIILPL